MKIFFCGVNYDKYRPERGPSFEYENFYRSLVKYPGAEVRYFPYDDILQSSRGQWNANLLAAVKEERPDLVFAFMYTDEFDPEILDELKLYTKTLAWFSDDHWRFENYSRVWAPHFSYVTTTYSRAVERYREIGVTNVIRSQWAFSEANYSAPSISEGGEQYNVSFVGGWSAPREKVIGGLVQRGIDVATFGAGWERGRVSEDDMIRIFADSKINLALNDAPGFLNKNSLGRLMYRRSLDKIVFDPHILSNAKAFLKRGIRQIKARHFMVPGVRGFTITAYADDIENYYEDGAEMIFYHDIDDLAQKISFYLAHEEQRRHIRDAGYKRTLNEHTYQKRFDDMFSQMGLR